ncbi:hypothetical protein LJK87_30615 [Paenibacillus sp. P25]|nr:hypothetical protein LJK87_30615 [Paenibacillus sp. P25]
MKKMHIVMSVLMAGSIIMAGCSTQSKLEGEAPSRLRARTRAQPEAK